ncbi:MAG: hypothetical protein ABIW79_01460 [Gemmatimonas sp.]
MHPPKKVRKQYTNTEYPLVILRFEDGHEIKIYQNTGKVFDAWPGETIKVMALYDPPSKDWELVEARKSDLFEDPKEGA